MRETSFWHWLWYSSQSFKQRFVGVITIVTSLFVTYKTIHQIIVFSHAPKFSPSSVILTISLVTFILLVFFIAYLHNSSPSILEIKSKDWRRPEDQLLWKLFDTSSQKIFHKLSDRAFRFHRRFVSLIIILFAIWFVYYAFKFFFLLFAYDLNTNLSDSLLLNWASSTTNVTTTFILFLSYYVLAHPDNIKNNQESNLSLNRATIIISCGFLLTLIINGFLHILPPHYESTLLASRVSMAATEGVVSCIAISLWVGRMDSKFLQVPYSLLSLLYLYAAFQVVLPFLENTLIRHNLSSSEFTALHRYGNVVVIGQCVAFIGKVSLFALLAYVISSRRLIHYFIRMHQVEANEIIRFESIIYRLSIPTKEERKRHRKAIRELEKKIDTCTERTSRSRCLGEISSLYLELLDLEKALDYANKSVEEDRLNHDMTARVDELNNFISNTDYRPDLNSMRKEDFRRLCGLSDQIASRIIDYRDAIGGFTRINQLLEIDGIRENSEEYTHIKQLMKVNSNSIRKHNLYEVTEASLRVFPQFQSEYEGEPIFKHIVKWRDQKSPEELKKSDLRHVIGQDLYNKIHGYLYAERI